MHIAIITGGASGEREVSIRSAQNINDLVGTFAQTTVFVFPQDRESFLDRRHEFDLAIPVIHGIGGEDGSLQGLLEYIGLPYLFSGIEAHAVGINKRRTKQIAKQIGIPVAHEFTRENAVYPIFAKPLRGGSTVHAGVMHNAQDLNDLLRIESDLILEEQVVGREFTVAVVDRGGECIALPVIEIIAQGGVFDFESKYNPEKLAQEICPANISEEVSKQLQSYALAIHKELGARHMSRSDFLIDNAGRIVFLEINTIPGFTQTSLVPKALKEAGIDSVDLFKEWCEQGVS